MAEAVAEAPLPPHRRAVNFLCARSPSAIEWRLLNAAHRGMHRRMAAAGVPGVQISLAIDDRPIRTLAWGLADAQQRTPMREDTKWRLASLAKPVSALVMLRLIARGTFDLDEPLNHLLAGVMPADAPNRLTPRLLMSHAAGLAEKHPPHFGIEQPLPALLDVLRGACGEAFVPCFAPNRAAPNEYSGAGWMLLEHVISMRTGLSFNAVADEVLIRPLGLRAMTFRADARTGPNFSAEHKDGTPLPVTACPALAGSGLVSDTHDVASANREFALSVLGLAPDFLPSSLAREAVTPQPPGEAGATFTLTHFLHKRSPRTLTHGGYRPGLRSTVSVFPDAGITAVVATNSDTGLEAVKSWFGLLGAIAQARAGL